MSDKKNEEDILWEIGRRKGAGIIPFSISDKHENVYWLLGKERDMPGWAQGSCRWSDFGGSSHYMDEDEAHTAAREYFEETLGVVPLGIPEDFVADEKKQDHHHRNDEAIRRLASYLRQGNCLCKIHMSVRMSPDAKQSKELTAAARYEMFLNGLSEHDNNNNIKTAADWKHNVAYVVRIPWQPDLPERFNNMRNQLMRFNQQETDIFRMDRQIPHLYPFLRPGMHMPISFVPEEDEMLPERVKFVKNVSFANDCPPQTNNNGEGYPEEQHMVRNRNLECERDNRKLIVEYQPCCSVCADHDFEPHRQTCDCEKDTKIHIIDLNTMEMRDWAYQYKKIFHDRAYLFKVYNDLPVHVKDHRSFVKTIMFGKMVHIRVDKVHLEKQKIQWWSSDRLQEMMQNGGHFKGQYARICFLPSMSVAVEAVKELRGENICPSYHPAYVTSIPPAYYYNRNRNNNYSGGKRYTNNNNNNNNNRPRFTNSNNQIYSHHHKRSTTAIEGIISKTDETDDDDDDDNPKKSRRYSADI